MMKRKQFLGALAKASGIIVGLPVLIDSCSKDDDVVISDTVADCEIAPTETRGPFPNKTPADLVRENIVSDRIGVALLIELTIQQKSNNCLPLTDAIVDVWQCDSQGRYSEYGGTRMQSKNLTQVHFLRGRQSSNALGRVDFISIYPGWYRGRAPHIHLEVFDSNGHSLKVTQIAFPDDISNAVYTTANYNGAADTPNTRDGIFSNSLEGNMADEITGSVTDGYTLKKTIVV